MNKLLVAVLLLIAVPVAFAQSSGGSHGSGLGVTISTVANLPASPKTGSVAVVTDGNSASDCTVGGGSNLVFCRFGGSSWGTFPAGSAGAGGSNTQIQWNNSTALGGVSGWTTNGTTQLNAAATSILDLSAITTGQFKIPSSAGATSSATKMFAFDTTAGFIHGWNGADTIWPQNLVSVSHQFVTSFTQTSGVFGTAQPACADLSNSATSCSTDATNASNIGSGTLAAARMNPTVSAHTFLGNNTGSSAAAAFLQPACADLSNSSGGCSMSTTAAGDLSGTLPGPTVAKINGNSVPSGAAAHQVLVATSASTFTLKTINDCTGGASALSYAQSGDAFGCLGSVVTGTLTSGRIEFANGTNSLTDSANLLYAAGSGISQIQGANAVDAYYIKRFTDTTPTGNFLHFQDAGALNDLFKVDVLGNVTATSYSSTNPNGNAGMLSLVQGTAPSAVANAVNFQAPTSVTTYTLTFPAAIAAGLFRTSSGGSMAFAELSGDATTSGSNAVTVVKVNGVSYAASPSTDTTPIITAANTATYTAIPNCSADATHAEQYNTSTHTWACAGITATATPASPSTSVQFNNGGAMGGSANLTWVSPVLTIGASGVTGQLSIAGSTSGATALQAAATASGTLTLPATTDTLIAKATTDTLTNKTFDTGGTGNVFKIAGTSITAIGGNTATLGSTSGTLTASNFASFDSNHNIVDSTVATANVVTAASAAAGAKQICTSSGASKTCSYIDFPATFYIPAANCINTTAGSGWSTGATPVPLCRAGTNNKNGLLSPWGATDTASFIVHLPNDWDSAASLDISLDLTSTDATNAHTIIMQAATACYKGDGTTTDDVAYNTAQSFGTITLNGNANRTWNATLTGLTKTGCTAGSTLSIKISRTTDTATNVGVYGATVDVARLLAVQAN